MESKIYRSMKKVWGFILPGVCIVILAGGCASSKQEMIAKERLGMARSAYLQAKVDRNVEALATIPFIEAGKALQAAEEAGNANEMEQLAYLAERKSQIAIAIAEGKKAEQEAERLNKETLDIVAQKRTQEARIAQKEAERARRLALEEADKAAKAKMEAETRREEAERARALALAEAEKANKARMESEARAREAERARALAAAEAARAAKAKAEVDQLMRELSDLKAKQTERGIVLTIGDVLFATDKSDLSPNAMRSIDKLAEFLEKYPNRNVLIEGHTDSVGSDEYNLSLSERRADSAKNALLGRKIPAERIVTKGYGKKYPVAGNDTPSGRQQNRRVEVIILNEGVKAESQFRP